jgi:hypothetical protein
MSETDLKPDKQREEAMKKVIDLGLNYFWADGEKFNAMMKEEFYAAKDVLFGMGFDEYVEERALPLSPKDHHIFTPLATYRCKDSEGNFVWLDIFAVALGGMLITNEL